MAFSRILVQWSALKSFLSPLALFRWNCWKKWLRCAISSVQDGVNHGNERGFTWDFRSGMKQNNSSAILLTLYLNLISEGNHENRPSRPGYSCSIHCDDKCVHW